MKDRDWAAAPGFLLFEVPGERGRAVAGEREDEQRFTPVKPAGNRKARRRAEAVKRRG